MFPLFPSLITEGNATQVQIHATKALSRAAATPMALLRSAPPRASAPRRERTSPRVQSPRPRCLTVMEFLRTTESLLPLSERESTNSRQYPSIPVADPPSPPSPVLLRFRLAHAAPVTVRILSRSIWRLGDRTHYAWNPRNL
jgi:hypothetical protein